MPDAIGPMATVRRYADAFNKGDVKAMAAPTAGLPGFSDRLRFHRPFALPAAAQSWTTMMRPRITVVAREV
jgi:hypothetical protein